MNSLDCSLIVWEFLEYFANMPKTNRVIRVPHDVDTNDLDIEHI